MIDSNRRTILTTGAAATAMAAAPRVLAQQTTPGGAAMSFYEKGAVRIHYEEAGSGFPLLLIPGGGLNSTISFFTGNAPFNAIEEFKGEYRCITADLRNAPGGKSTGPASASAAPSSGICCGGPPTASSLACWRSRAARVRKSATRSMRTT
jgi:pimeloyl-ACP methyl ester carboxylesterase